jgi:alpha-galactosidase
MRLLLLLTLAIVPGSSLGSKSGLGKLPALGWNSWNAYACEINEKKFLKAAEYIVKLGLKVCHPLDDIADDLGCWV